MHGKFVGWRAGGDGSEWEGEREGLCLELAG